MICSGEVRVTGHTCSELDSLAVIDLCLNDGLNLSSILVSVQLRLKSWLLLLDSLLRDLICLSNEALQPLLDVLPCFESFLKVLDHRPVVRRIVNVDDFI